MIFLLPKLFKSPLVPSEFPIADGQHIVRYALDIEGKLREGVIVEKAKARAAFENTIRQKIDPGLVEKTKGNNFRTRISPRLLLPISLS